MDRRIFFLSNFRNTIFASMTLQAVQGCNEINKKSEVSTSDYLEPYSGQWDYKQAAFLLRRTTFGISSSQIKKSVTLGMNQTISKLFEKMPEPLPPLNYEYKNDINVPIGKTWIKAPYIKGNNDVKFVESRKKSLCAWTMEILIDDRISIREQLTLFWHNFFGVSDIGEHKFEYEHIKLLREFAFGNYKELLCRVTVDPAMLEFLNGNLNSKGSPNENYAREMLELFTVGKGKLAGKGDYSTFTEHDVKEVAKVLTGWQHEGFFSFNPEDNNKDIVKSRFNILTHDNSIKHLSNRFGNSYVPDMLGYEYKYLINIICEQEHTALNVCRRLYRWFVHHNIDEQIENNIIIPMAEQLKESDYELIPVLTTLFKSKHFFEAAERFPKIKNPIEYTIGIINYFNIKAPEELSSRYRFHYGLFETCATMGMEYFFPPSVAGWKAYYQGPLYYRFWINASTLQSRKKFADDISKNGLDVDGHQIKIQPAAVFKSLEYPNNPDAVVEEISNLLFVQEISDKQKLILKNILMGEFSQKEWSEQVDDYIRNYSNFTVKSHPVESGFVAFINYIFCMPEFNVI